MITRQLSDFVNQNLTLVDDSIGVLGFLKAKQELVGDRGLQLNL